VKFVNDTPMNNTNREQDKGLKQYLTTPLTTTTTARKKKKTPLMEDYLNNRIPYLFAE